MARCCSMCRAQPASTHGCRQSSTRCWCCCTMRILTTMPPRRHATVNHRAGLRAGLRLQPDGITPHDVMTGAVRIEPTHVADVPGEIDAAMLNWDIVNRELNSAKEDVLQQQEILGIKGLLQQQERDDAAGTPYIRSILLDEATGDVTRMHCQLIQGSKMMHSRDENEVHIQFDVQFKPGKHWLIFEGAINNAKIGSPLLCSGYIASRKLRSTSWNISSSLLMLVKLMVILWIGLLSSP